MTGFSFETTGELPGTVWTFDLTTTTWSSTTFPGVAGVPMRFDAACVVHGNNLVMIGGTSFSETDTSNTAVFSLDTQQWIQGVVQDLDCRSEPKFVAVGFSSSAMNGIYAALPGTSPTQRFEYSNGFFYLFFGYYESGLAWIFSTTRGVATGPAVVAVSRSCVARYPHDCSWAGRGSTKADTVELSCLFKACQQGNLVIAGSSITGLNGMWTRPVAKTFINDHYYYEKNPYILWFKSPTWTIGEGDLNLNPVPLSCSRDSLHECWDSGSQPTERLIGGLNATLRCQRAVADCSADAVWSAGATATTLNGLWKRPSNDLISDGHYFYTKDGYELRFSKVDGTYRWNIAVGSQIFAFTNCIEQYVQDCSMWFEGDAAHFKNSNLRLTCSRCSPEVAALAPKPCPDPFCVECDDGRCVRCPTNFYIASNGNCTACTGPSSCGGGLVLIDSCATGTGTADQSCTGACVTQQLGCTYRATDCSYYDMSFLSTYYGSPALTYFEPNEYDYTLNLCSASSCGSPVCQYSRIYGANLATGSSTVAFTDAVVSPINQGLRVNYAVISNDCGGFGGRSTTVDIICDFSYPAPRIVSVVEPSPCQYVFTVRAVQVCPSWRVAGCRDIPCATYKFQLTEPLTAVTGCSPTAVSGTADTSRSDDSGVGGPGSMATTTGVNNTATLFTPVAFYHFPYSMSYTSIYFSVSFWARPTASTGTWQGMVSNVCYQCNGLQGQGWAFYITSYNWWHFRVYAIDNTYTAADSSALTYGEWHHVAGTYNDATRKVMLYVNGDLRGTGFPLTYMAANPSASLVVAAGEQQDDGATFVRYPYSGAIQDVAYFDFELNPSLVRADYLQSACPAVSTSPTPSPSPLSLSATISPSPSPSESPLGPVSPSPSSGNSATYVLYQNAYIPSDQPYYAYVGNFWNMINVTVQPDADHERTIELTDGWVRWLYIGYRPAASPPRVAFNSFDGSVWYAEQSNFVYPTVTAGTPFTLMIKRVNGALNVYHDGRLLTAYLPPFSEISPMYLNVMSVMGLGMTVSAYAQTCAPIANCLEIMCTTSSDATCLACAPGTYGTGTNNCAPCTAIANCAPGATVCSTAADEICNICLTGGGARCVELDAGAETTYSVLPESLGGHTANTVDGGMVVIGGKDIQNNLNVTDVYVLNFASLSWSRPVSLPRRFVHHSAVYTDSFHKVVVYGGGDGMVYVLDVDLWQWLPLPTTNDPGIVSHHVASVDCVGGGNCKMMIHGGMRGTDCSQQESTTYLLDLYTMIWSTGPTGGPPAYNKFTRCSVDDISYSFPAGVDVVGGPALRAVTIEGNAYVVGGAGPDVYVFSWATETWSSFVPLGSFRPLANGAFSLAALGDYIVIHGGIEIEVSGVPVDSSGQAVVAVLSLHSREWTYGNTRADDRIFHTATIYDNAVVVYGGVSFANWGARDMVVVDLAVYPRIVIDPVNGNNAACQATRGRVPCRTLRLANDAFTFNAQGGNVVSTLRPTFVLANTHHENSITISHPVHIMGPGTLDCGKLANCISVIGGGLSLDGVTVRNGHSAQSGGCISLGGGESSFKNTRFDNCETLSNGGAVFVGSLAQLQLLNSTFAANKAASNGGAILAAESSLPGVFRLVANSSTFEDNAATNGGAIALEGYDYMVNQVHFLRNMAFQNGGAMTVTGATAVQQTTFDDNWAGVNGGAMFIAMAQYTVALADITATGNTGGTGGAIACVGGGTTFDEVRMSSATFVGNTAFRGGALDMDGCAMHFAGVRVTQNTAMQFGGGGIYHTRTSVDTAAPWFPFPGASNTISNNVALADGAPGPNLFTDPVALDVMPPAEFVTSGSNAPYFTVQAVDYYGQNASTYSGATCVATPPSFPEVTLINDRTSIVAGVATFSNLRLFALNGTYNVTFSVSNAVHIAPGSDLFIVRPCVPGEELTDGGCSTKCVCAPCQEGQFSNSFNAECQNCPPGTHQSKTGSTTCDLCPAGSFESKSGQKECTECPAGQFSNTTGLTGCYACPAGTYNAGDTAKTSCVTCDPGSVAFGGASQCTPCAAGQFANNGVCDVCPVGTYSEDAGSIRCRKCAVGSYNTEIGRSSCTECGNGTFTVSPVIPCMTCPAETTCAKNIIFARKDYWLYDVILLVPPAYANYTYSSRDVVTSARSVRTERATSIVAIDVTPTFYVGQCPDGTCNFNNTCTPPHRGELCGDCVEPYQVVAGNKCVLCDKSGANVVLALLLYFFIPFFFVIKFVYFSKTSKAAAFVIFINFGQMMGLLLALTPVVPESIETLFAAFSSTGTSSVSGCIVRTTVFQRYWLSLMQPFYMTVLVFCVYLIERGCGRCSDGCKRYRVGRDLSLSSSGDDAKDPTVEKKKKPGLKTIFKEAGMRGVLGHLVDPQKPNFRYLKAIALCVTFTYVPVVKTIFAMLQCRAPHPKEASIRLLVSDLTVQCRDSAGELTPDYKPYFYLSCVLLALYAYALPIGMFSIMTRIHRNGPDKDKKLHRIFGGYGTPFEKNFFFFPAVSIAERTLLVTILTFGGTKDVQRLGFVFIFTCYAALYFMFKPYAEDRSDFFEGISHATLTAFAIVISSSWVQQTATEKGLFDLTLTLTVTPLAMMVLVFIIFAIFEKKLRKITPKGCCGSGPASSAAGVTLSESYADSSALVPDSSGAENANATDVRRTPAHLKDHWRTDGSSYVSGYSRTGTGSYYDYSSASRDSLDSRSRGSFTDATRTDTRTDATRTESSGRNSRFSRSRSKTRTTTATTSGTEHSGASSE